MYHRDYVIARARHLLETNNFVVLDTETTGLGDDDEPVEIVVLGPDGRVLLSSLIRPTIPIPSRATRVHGISNEMVAKAPTFQEFWPSLSACLYRRHILAYNVAFDRRMIEQTARRQGLPMFPAAWGCLMQAFKSYASRPQWTKLAEACQALGIPAPHAHRAHDDAMLALSLLRALACVDRGQSADERAALLSQPALLGVTG